MYQLAIFDLDGTLLDTLADLRQGINYALGTQGFAPRSMAEVRAFVGNGIWKLVERAVPAGTSEAQMDAVYEAFNPYYARHCADLTVAHGFSRKTLDAHHAKTARQVSNGILPVQELAALFSRYVHVTVQISDEEMYQVAGRYAP